MTGMFLGRGQWLRSGKRVHAGSNPATARLPPFFNFLLCVCVVKPACKKCSKALQELENIDDEADQLGIGFVKIQDEDLAEEYNLGELPRLVYYRHQIPIIYESKQYNVAGLKVKLLGVFIYRRAYARGGRARVAGPE